MPREAAYTVKNWSCISALLSGNQSQFNFETLITAETNYERQDLKPLIKAGVNKAKQHYHWGDSGRDLSPGGLSLPGNYRSETGQGSTPRGSVGDPKLGLEAHQCLVSEQVGSSLCTKLGVTWEARVERRCFCDQSPPPEWSGEAREGEAEGRL